MDAPATVPFSTRLRELREGLGPHATQAWLSEKSGVDRSLISRLERGERLPTFEALRWLAPVLGVEVDALVAGTDAEGRLQDPGDSVPLADFQGAVATIANLQSKASDLEAINRSANETIAQERAARRAAEKALSDLRAAADRDAAKHRELQARFDAQGEELRRHRDMLTQAMADLSSLKKQGAELARELAETQKSAKATSLLATIGAAGSLMTLAHFLNNDTQEAKKPRSASGRGTKGGTR